MLEKSTLKDNIKLASDFQYSINIAYDISNDEKIKHFIPTIASIELLEDLLVSTYPASKDRARVLVGAYGKGKSHILLILLSILNRKDKSLFSKLLRSIDNYNNDLYKYVEQYIDSSRKILPVIIQGNSTSISQSLLNGLQRALIDNKLEYIMPETHFHAAVNVIKRWEKEYPTTYKSFISIINMPINEYMDKLNSFDSSAFELFTDIYPSLTSGSEFNAFSGLNVVELYESVIKELKSDSQSNYDGIYVVYDEFSKFLESGISKITPGDIKLLQDFAEKCNRSGENQLHLLLVSHKEISNYIDTLPKQKVDGWRGVSERFKHVEIHNNFSQIYEVIQKVINIDEKYAESLFANNEKNEKAINELVVRTNMFSELSQKEIMGITKLCYPLHPVSTFMLPRISEKVAQNERTIFTFLSSNQRNALSMFINNAKSLFPVLTPDFIYDYFEPLFKKEIYTSNIYKTWKLANEIISRLDTDDIQYKEIKKKIIKAIALIYIVEQFDKLSPYSDVIIDMYRSLEFNREEIVVALEELISKQYVIYQKESNQYLKLKESSGVNIEMLVTNTIEKNRHLYSVKSILNENNIERYLYPVSYNDDNEITRYFEVEFVYGDDISGIQNFDSELESTNAVGRIFAVIDSAKNVNYEILCDRILIITNDTTIDVESFVYRYQAIKDLKEQYRLEAEKTLCQELDIYYDDLREMLSQYINSYLRPEARAAKYYHLGEKLSIYRKSNLTRLLSEICDKTFQHTPIINNELINRDEISTQVLKSRNKVIEGILQNQLQPNLSLVGYGQDVTIMRTVLINTGILINSDISPEVKIFGLENQKIQNVMRLINDHLHNSSEQEPTAFEELYNKLISAKNGIGLKKGIIPVLLAAVMHHLKQHLVVLYKDREMELTANLLNDINNEPSSYCFFLEGWNNEKREYIDELEKIFGDFIIQSEKEYNAFTYVVKAMQRWYIGLPGYSRDIRKLYDSNGRYKPLSPEVIKFRNSLRSPSINSREFLFDKLYKIFGYKEMTTQLVANIKHCKHILDSAVLLTIESIVSDLKDIFYDNDNKNATLSSILLNWSDKLGTDVKEYVFDNGEEKILKLLSTATSDEKYLVNRLAKAVTGLRVDDWGDNNPVEFIKTIKTQKENIENYRKAEKDFAGDISNSYTLIINEGQLSLKKSFDRVDYSSQAKILLTDLTSIIEEEYGDSISESEKRQVLVELLSKFVR